MTLLSEKQYLRELKITHEKQVKNGKVINAKNTLSLIYDCEKRIELYEKCKVKSVTLQSDGIIWKPLLGYEKTHLISSSGLIKKKSYYCINKIGIKRLIQDQLVALYNFRNYQKVVISTKNSTKTYTVSNLVYLNFTGDIPEGFMAKNKDGVLENNDVSNLYLSKIDCTIKKYRNKSLSV